MTHVGVDDGRIAHRVRLYGDVALGQRDKARRRYRDVRLVQGPHVSRGWALRVENRLEEKFHSRPIRETGVDDRAGAH